MPGSIPLTGLAANDPVPGNYIEINFAQGAASLGTGTYAILLMGNKLSTGSATVDTVIYGPVSATPLVTTQDAISLFGQGSELHRMWLRTVKVNQGVPVYAIAVTESAGAKATGIVTFATSATANGSVRTYVGDDFVDTAVTSGDNVTTIAAAVAVDVNTRLDWAVTATSALGVLTLTAKQKGPRGNFIRFAAVMSSSSMGTTSTVSAPVFMGAAATGGVDGSTADSNATALTTILPFRFYYIVSAAEDATQFGAVVTQIGTQAQPLTGIRQRAITGAVGTSGATVTIATGINSARAGIAWLQNSEFTPSELGANLAAVIALEEAPLQFKCNFSGYGNDASSSTHWFVKAPRSGTAPTRATIKTVLNNGITPIGVNANGSTYIVKLITTRSLNGASPDYRVRDWHKVTICDRYADDLYAKLVANFQGKQIADDPLTGQRIPGGSVVTPRVMKAAINKLTNDYNELDLLQNVAAILADTQVIRESSPTTRMSARIPLQPIDILDQTATAIDQVA